MARGSLVAADIAEQPRLVGSVLDANAEALGEARRLVSGARLVRLVGIGSSRHAAGFGAEVLEALAGVPAAAAPSPGVGVPRPVLDPDDLLIAVSQSGETPSLVDAVGAAGTAGTAVIAVTNVPGSPLTDAATLTLCCGAGTERVVAATKSVTTSLVLLRALAGRVDAERLSSALGTVVEGPDPTMPGFSPDAVAWGGIAGGPLASEVAVKAAEMAGRLPSPSSLVDHLHGPVAASRSTLAFVGPDDPNARRLGPARATRVGPDPAYEVPVPSIGDASLDAIVALVMGQRLMRAWALSSGEDPDAPRGLDKVTRTQ